MSIAVAFFWHMHQPYYKDILTNEYGMPWVRFHATKAYYDVASILEDFPKVKQTFNLVPSLIIQLQDYMQGNAKDIFLDLSRKAAKELNDEDKKYLLWNFFMTNWDTMIKPYERYWELLHKRGVKITEEDMPDAVKKFTDKDYRDLQVWFNLTWFGFQARKKFPQVQELISKGKNFTEEDKKTVLNTQIKVIEEIIPLYKKLQDSGQIEVTTSPFYHPILPLIYDTNIAKRSMPWVDLPHRFSQPEDVEAQLRQSVETYKKIFNRNPQGLWPSEGSVCPEIIPIIAKQGIKWLVTDEDILLKSITVKDRGQGLYKPYRFSYNGNYISLVFRDKGLSNAISFVYSKQNHQDAVNDLLQNLHNIRKYVTQRGGEPLVNIVLDGENPWEYYPCGGELFLKTLFERLSDDPYLCTTTISKYIEEHPQQETLSSLHSGSWINHNFDIWIGDPEENTAWNHLGKTRDFLKKEESNRKITKDKIKLAWQSLYAAEGSDWFWWYGDDFTTDCDEEFDQLFRTHLGNVYKILGYDVPEYLKEPIIYIKEVHATRLPIAFINPTLDGMNTHFYEWSDAGYYKAKRGGRTLYRAESYLSGIYFGFDISTLFIRIDPLISSAEIDGRDLRIYFNTIEPKEYQIVFPLSLIPEKVQQFILNRSKDGVNFQKVKDYSSIKVKDIFEFSIPFSELGFKPKETVHFFVQVKKDGIQLDRYPRRGYISFKVPDKEFELDEWMV